MDTEDKTEFNQLVGMTFETYGRKKPSMGVLEVWRGVFTPYPMADVREAFSRAVAESREFLVPAAVRAYLPDRSGFLSPEEAWNHLPKDEREAGWVYPEMMSAAGAAWDSIDRGDLVAGRMAFIESYKKIVADAKQSGNRPKWFYSESNYLTHEQRQELKYRNTLIAAEKKWLPIDYANNILRICGPSSESPEIKQLAAGVGKRHSAGNGSKRIEQN